MTGKKKKKKKKPPRVCFFNVFRRLNLVSAVFSGPPLSYVSLLVLSKENTFWEIFWVLTLYTPSQFLAGPAPSYAGPAPIITNPPVPP